MPTSHPSTAIVTGAGQGLGAATALRLAREGHTVAVVDVNVETAQATARQITEAGGRALAIEADVSDESQVVAAVEQTAQELGAPTILVNNAGILRDNLLFKMSATDWDEVMGVHLRGAFLMTRQVQQHMVALGGGRIVNISSIAALGNRGQVNYSAAKAGLQGFTKTLSIELGRYQITANAIAPGFIETDMTRATAARMRMDFEDLRAGAEQQIPLGRIGQPDDIASVVAFFTGPDSAYVTGQVLYVSGGPAD
jgi:3-oxoacyl-[acyl-carrier protein] reductase